MAITVTTFPNVTKIEKNFQVENKFILRTSSIEKAMIRQSGGNKQIMCQLNTVSNIISQTSGTPTLNKTHLTTIDIRNVSSMKFVHHSPKSITTATMHVT